MKKSIILSTLFFILFHSYAIYGNPDYYFRCLNTENGLSQNTVLSILQDKTGFMWFGTKDGLNRYDGYSVKIFKNEDNDPVSLGNNTVWSLLEMPDGKIWAGTDWGIYIYDPIDDSFEFLDAKTTNGEGITRAVMDMKMDTEGNVWIASNDIYRYSIHTGKLETVMYMVQVFKDGTAFFPRSWSINMDNDSQVWFSLIHGGIRKYNSKTGQLNYYVKDESGNDLTYSLISNTLNVNNNYLLIGSFNNGLRLMDKTTGIITSYKLGVEKKYPDLFIRTMEIFSDDNIWIGTESGLYIHNFASKETRHLTHNFNDPYSLSDNAIYSLFQDREGGVWVGTYFGGVNYFPLPYASFEKHYPVTGQNSISGERVSGICEDREGIIWIGTEDAGLNKLNVKTFEFEHLNASNSGLNYNNVHDIISDGNDLWIATYSHGINVFNTKTKQWKYHLKSEEAGSLNNNDIFALFRDKSAQIWIGTSDGAFLFDRQQEQFIPVEAMQGHFVSDILEDKLGKIWFATYDNGAYCFNPRTKMYTHYTYEPDNLFSLCSHRITCLFLDSKDRLWFGSEARGICMLDENRQQFMRYGKKDGFSNDVIYKILEDNDKNLWLSSNLGLMRFNPESREIRSFTRNNGLTGNQFNYKSGYKDSSGKMYFGSLNGMVTFKPSEFSLNKLIPPVVITEFTLDNNRIPVTKKEEKSNSIQVKHNRTSFSLNFASLSFVAPEMNKYAYKMEGLENEWSYLTAPQKIIYSNLPPGKYAFRVKASNNDGIWNEEGESIEIRILPPFRQTIPAYLMYFLIILGIIWYLIHSYKAKLEKLNRRKELLLENRVENEIYNSKIEFFTNVAHEIRTPLTLIKGPLEYILKKEIKKDELIRNLHIMEKNTDRLLSLANQLLDFRKTESGHFSLTFTYVNVRELIYETYIRFHPVASQKALFFELQAPENDLFAAVDKEALTKIISNLFTNAVKYAATYVLVRLAEYPDHIVLSVMNDGYLIPESMKEKIFDAFFQLKENNHPSGAGSGVGLALVKSLTELHDGTICLDTSVKDANCFVVKLPRKQEKVIETEKKEVLSGHTGRFPEPVFPVKDKKTATLLLVEDNEELLQFICERLEKQYMVLKAGNGIEAIEILEKEPVNLVISDIIMPRMDGLQLCKKIKEEIEYSHIPLILLTAKANIQSRIIGLESGADAYIEKPFSIEHLEAQIQNLLNNRKKIRESFTHLPLVHTDSMALTKADEQFLKKITDVIHKNMANPEFSVEDLAEELCMSRSSLLRKIKGVSDSTPNDFIRLVRLKRAAEIMKEGQYKVNEICYLVGISPSYFTKAFQKQFGVLPKDFIKNTKKKEENY